MPEKNLARDMKQKQQNQKLLEKIRKIENEIKLEKGTDNISVRYHEDCELTLGGNVIKVSVAEVEEKPTKCTKREEVSTEKDANNNKEKNDISKTYNIYLNIKGQDIKIAEINEEGNLILNEEVVEQIDPKNVMGLKQLGENEKPDISEINKVEGKTSEELIDSMIESLNEEELEEFKEYLSEEEIPEDEKLENLMKIEAKQTGISKEEFQSNMIEIDLDGKKVTKNNNFREVARIDKSIKRAWIAPRKRFV